MLQNTANTVIDSCLFTKLDGNAIMLNGFNLDTVISNNEFLFIGNNAIASWGFTNFWDGLDPQQPVGTSVLYNLCHEIGHFEKQ